MILALGELPLEQRRQASWSALIAPGPIKLASMLERPHSPVAFHHVERARKVRRFGASNGLLSKIVAGQIESIANPCFAITSRYSVTERTLRCIG